MVRLLLGELGFSFPSMPGSPTEKLIHQAQKITQYVTDAIAIKYNGITPGTPLVIYILREERERRELQQ